MRVAREPFNFANHDEINVLEFRDYSVEVERVGDNWSVLVIDWRKGAEAARTNRTRYTVPVSIFNPTCKGIILEATGRKRLWPRFGTRRVAASPRN